METNNKITNEKNVVKVISAGIVFNFVLFFTKLYVGLSVNSICIWSDAMNNLADTLSCVLSTAFMLVALKVGSRGISYVIGKAEQLLLFALAVVVAVVGLGFAYSSIERFMYPTPVWFSTKYFFVILLTALAKLGMFFFYRFFEKRISSPVIKILSTDCILDFFITTATLISFTLTRYTEFTVDALFGMIISVIIVVNAVKMTKQAVCALLNIVPLDKREKLEEVISSFEAIEKNGEISYYIDRDENITANVKVLIKEDYSFENVSALTECIKSKCFEATGMEINLLL